MPTRRLFRIILTVIAVALVAWVGGFALFVASLPDRVSAPDRRTDAIVVLTGGRERVAAGIDLLRDDRAGLLFVSGVYGGAARDELIRAAGREPDSGDSRIILGREARDTRGNARETAAWAATAEVRSIRLVTAFYHMPRSLLAFGRTAPELAVVPHPVFPEGSARSPWWRGRDGTRLLAAEYTKYLLALAGMGEPAS